MSKEQKLGFLEHYYRGLSTDDLVDLYRRGALSEVATEAVLEVFREREVQMDELLIPSPLVGEG